MDEIHPIDLYWIEFQFRCKSSRMTTEGVSVSFRWETYKKWATVWVLFVCQLIIIDWCFEGGSPAGSYVGETFQDVKKTRPKKLEAFWYSGVIELAEREIQEKSFLNSLLSSVGREKKLRILWCVCQQKQNSWEKGIFSLKTYLEGLKAESISKHFFDETKRTETFQLLVKLN